MQSNQLMWQAAAEDIHWYTRPTATLDDSRSPHNFWFPGGTTNACFNCLDIHVQQGRGQQTALIYDSPLTDNRQQFTYAELLNKVARLAGAMSSMGVVKGDRVIIYMPMVPEALIAMLACARIGAIHSVVFGGFAGPELAVRIDDAQPRLVLSASCGIEPGRVVAYKPLLDEAIELARHKPDACLILQRPQLPADLIQGRDHDWQSAQQQAEAVDPVPVEANHPLYILYTSGTTGQPKGVVRDTGGSLVALKWSMKSIYGVQPGEVFWAASDVGWVVGHSYIVYGPLLNGNTTVIYEGKPVGTPDAGAFWRVIESYRVSVMFTAPTAFRAIRKEDPQAKLIADRDLGNFRALFLAGERCDPDTLFWAQQQLGVPVIDHWWQTETGWSICANCLGIEQGPVVPGSAGRAVPGYEVQALSDTGEPLDANETGALAVKLPLPPGTFTGIWGAEERFRQTYFNRFPGYYETGDAGYLDENGYVFVMSRTDDVINVAGHRLDTGAIEEVLAGHPAVAECAVFGVADDLKGEIPLGLVVLNSGVEIEEQQLRIELVQRVRNTLGPVAAFKTCTRVIRLPKTRSGKILRSTMRRMANGQEWSLPATIDDPAILEEIELALGQLGYGHSADS